MARTQSAVADIKRERNVQVVRIGNNLNQLARGANTHTSAAEAVTVVANLVACERSLRAVARFGGEDGDAHELRHTRCRLRPRCGRPSRRRPRLRLAGAWANAKPYNQSAQNAVFTTRELDQPRSLAHHR